MWTIYFGPWHFMSALWISSTTITLSIKWVFCVEFFFNESELRQKECMGLREILLSSNGMLPILLLGGPHLRSQGANEQFLGSPGAPGPMTLALITLCTHTQSSENWDCSVRLFVPQRTSFRAKEARSTEEEVCPGPSPAPDTTSGRLSAQSCSSFPR